MAGFAQMTTMEVWYAHLNSDEIMAVVRKSAKGKQGAKEAKRAEKVVKKARTRDSLQALSKLGELVDGRYRIKSQPPIVVPERELARFAISSGRIEPPSRMTGATCSRSSSSSTSPARWSASEASALGRSSSCSRAETSRTRSSCR